MLSALILGPIFTTLGLQDYFTSRETLTYFLNIVGIIQYTLPGVFETNPHAGVNWSLWTIPYELKCYVIAALMVPLLRRSRGWIILLIAFAWFSFSSDMNEGAFGGGPWVSVLTQALFTSIGNGLFTSFIMGYGLYAVRHRIPYDWRLASVAAMFLLVIAMTGRGIPTIAPLVWVAVAYLTVFTGVSRIPRTPILGRGDYSYGIYLYGIPVQQAVRATFPDLQNAAAYLAIVIVAVLPLAMFAWHCVEKPVIGLRKRFSFIVRARGIDPNAPTEVGAPPPVIDPSSGETLSFGSVGAPSVSPDTSR